MQRCDLQNVVNDRGDCTYLAMRPRADGDWVLYSEAQAEIDRLNQRIKELEESQEHLHE